MNKLYTKQTLDNFALHSAIKLIDWQDEEHTGWLVPSPHDPKGYLLLPFNYNDNCWHFKRSHIKKIYHLTNGHLIPKDVYRK